MTATSTESRDWEDVVVPDADNARRPSLWDQAQEWGVALEFAATHLSKNLVDRWPVGDGHPVLVLPGFLAGQVSTIHLRNLLNRLGYDAHDWALGRNYGYREDMEEKMHALIADLRERHGRSVSLIGWSLGGIYAREIARAVPDHVRQVITLGSPFRGNHQATRAYRLYQFLNRNPLNEDMMSETARISRAAPLPVPSTSIYSRTDGIVAWECCTSLPAPQTENIEVRSTHLGYGFNLETMFVVADRLALPEGQWRPYRRAVAS
jgi:pimeloyl-ACP methyl ester carboxylesterase